MVLQKILYCGINSHLFTIHDYCMYGFTPETHVYLESLYVLLNITKITT